MACGTVQKTAGRRDAARRFDSYALRHIPNQAPHGASFISSPARGNHLAAPHGAKDGLHRPERRCLMADNPNVETNENPAQGGGGNEPDYKALYEQLKSESRKWEERAKANKDKADKWDAAAAGNESVEDRIAKLEAENKAMKDAEKRHALVVKVANETGLSESMVSTLSGADEDSLMEQAKAIADAIDAAKPTGAPNVPEAGKFPREKDGEKSAAQAFGDAFDRMLS